ncbi:MAG: folate-binding protein [Sphingomonadaceae bacterium]|nr:folate-binding protein [Sphingomonadaceae bacterium]
MPTVSLVDRALLHVTGADARPFLQGLLTNDVLSLSPERPLWAGLLSPQGKALFDMILFDDGAGGLWIDCEAARADELAKRLTMYKLRRAVAIERTGLCTLATWGGELRDGWPDDPRLAALGQRSPGYPDQAEPDNGRYAAYRIALGVPEGAGELGVDKTLWLETNAVELNGVSFAKGCYVGQENTARMYYRDRVRRRLLPVRIDSEPGAATKLMAGEREAGELRARAGDIGMAWLRIELAERELRLGEANARVKWPEWLPR